MLKMVDGMFHIPSNFNSLSMLKFLKNDDKFNVIPFIVEKAKYLMEKNGSQI